MFRYETDVVFEICCYHFSTKPTKKTYLVVLSYQFLDSCQSSIYEISEKEKNACLMSACL